MNDHATLNAPWPRLALPTDRPRPARLETGRVMLDVALPDGDPLAAILALLHRYSGQSEIEIGLSDGAIRPLRMRITPETRFSDMVAQLTDARRNAVAASATPQMLVAFADSDIAADTELAIVVHAGQGICSWSASADLFDAATIARMAGHLRVLAAAAAASPDTVIGALPLLTEPERHRLLHEWGAAGPSPAPLRCLHEMFAVQVARAPDAVAISMGDRALSYAELDAAARALAARLTAEGASPERLIGLCMDRSPELVVGILAILKSGAAYVPIDPDGPPERQQMIAEDAGLTLMLTSPETSARVAALHGDRLRLIEVRSDAGTDVPPLAPAVAPTVQPGHAAYVIFTSGSTGRPKGVLVTHANVCRLLTATDPQFHFGPSDVWTLFHSFAFDFSVWEIWGALAFGGRVVVVPFAISRTPADFLKLVVHERVTVLNQTPSAFAALARAEEQAGGLALPDLRVVIFGGEALDMRMLRGWVRRHGLTHPALVNMYGITETTVHVTHHTVTDADLAHHRSVIGRPISDLSAYVRDAQQQPVPIGVTGELYVGGAGVARGYLGRPDLTEARFLPDPFSADPTAKLYRTGDLVRWLPDSTLEYLGRIDHQVKIRGFRIELGEIEAALSLHPNIKDCVVLPHEHRPGEHMLVGYLVGAAEVPQREIDRHLAARLPDYMVPSAYVWLAALPMTEHGKLDRRALPAPGAAAAPAASFDSEAAAEAALTPIWHDVLECPVARDANFFDLGGTSQRLMQLQATLMRVLGRDVPLVELFGRPTIAAQASFLVGSATRDVSAARERGARQAAALRRFKPK
jgi:amino acid adenylation domain-containing protein